MQNANSIDALVEDLLNGDYPFLDEDTLDYQLFLGRSITLDNPMFYFEKLSHSSDYLVLQLLAHAIYDTYGKFTIDHGKQFMEIFKRLLGHKIDSLGFQIIEGLPMVLNDKEDYAYFLKLMEQTIPLQNQALYFMSFFNEDELKLLDDISAEDCFKSFFIDYKTDVDLLSHKDFLSGKSNLYKKIYITGLYRKGYKKVELFKLVDSTNHDLMRYIYRFLYTPER